MAHIQTNSWQFRSEKEITLDTLWKDWNTQTSCNKEVEDEWCPYLLPANSQICKEYKQLLQENHAAQVLLVDGNVHYA